MNLKNEIDTELWECISKNYEAENYKGTIIDSIFMLTDTIRNKTGLEGDGASLIGQAFGGDNPRIKINNMQTDSEKDAQRGIQEILRGIYTGIRNPRSHDSIIDEKVSADSIIIFINYLLNLLDKSKLRFEEKEYLKRVFDPYYVKSEEYSKLLVGDIPKRQRANIAITVILKRTEGDIYSLGYFLKALLQEIEDDELSRICNVISEELRITTDNKEIRYILHMFPANYWKFIDISVRMRIENLLYEDFSKGTYNKKSGNCGSHGALATWITAKYLNSFIDLEKWTRQTLYMMKSENEQEKAYAEEYFWEMIIQANRDNITLPLKYYLSEGLNNNNADVIELIMEELEWDEEHPWWRVFEEELKQYPEIMLFGLR